MVVSALDGVLFKLARGAADVVGAADETDGVMRGKIPTCGNTGLAPATGGAPEDVSTSLGLGGAITLHGLYGGMTGTLPAPSPSPQPPAAIFGFGQLIYPTKHVRKHSIFFGAKAHRVGCHFHLVTLSFVYCLVAAKRHYRPSPGFRALDH
ncbi:hypothetical protein PoB_002261700 [Plakobranchus ocellatus]|uniref:Uncharacterized protein n=1 Tax=Plakobranchus ocellatus TaxID=259542 RepID=A0AAV3ZNL3_9GAST|nr:hypothetical protein PoB_002261700 [Plakobranchus ocellatus]